MPADIEPSPITAIDVVLVVTRQVALATAMPRPAEIEVEECAGAEGVVFGLSLRLVKPERPPPWRKRADAIATAGEDLVGIRLVPDVPDDPVGRGVEDVVQRDGQLDHAEAGPEMPARHRDRARSSRHAVPCATCAQIGSRASLAQEVRRRDSCQAAVSSTDHASQSPSVDAEYWLMPLSESVHKTYANTANYRGCTTCSSTALAGGASDWIPNFPRRKHRDFGSCFRPIVHFRDPDTCLSICCP